MGTEVCQGGFKELTYVDCRKGAWHTVGAQQCWLQLLYNSAQWPGSQPSLGAETGG